MNRQQNVKAKKSLGQNFLRDEAVIDRIAAVIEPVSGELIVEVGPGRGALTDRLAPSGADVVAIELDDRLVPILETKYAADSNVRILHADVRRVHFAEELGERPYRVVGNLPYYITSSIVRLFLEQVAQPKEAYFMVQREVAERICAAPGGMSILSVAVQYYADPEILFEVPAEAFDPVPKVESAFMRLVPKRGYDHDRDHAFFRVVRAGFAARRKTLANNLASSFQLPKAGAEKLLADIGLATSIRAQELSVPQWEQLVESVREKGRFQGKAALAEKKS